MKYIKLFIASSIIEFAQERASLSDFIRLLNDIYVPRGIYFQLTICEDLSNAVAKDRKQAEYNQAIRESQYFTFSLAEALTGQTMPSTRLRNLIRHWISSEKPVLLRFTPTSGSCRRGNLPARTSVIS